VEEYFDSARQAADAWGRDATVISTFEKRLVVRAERP